MNVIYSKKVVQIDEYREEIIERQYLFPKLKIGIIIPVYNEEENIGAVLSNIPNNLSQITDIILVDDGSCDQTVKICETYDLVLLKHKKNKGNGAATRTGLEYCKNRDYHVIVIMDGDGQHNPAYLSKLIKNVVYKGYDFVIANRFKHYYNMNPKKKICSLIMTVFYLFLFRKKISDPTNGYRALSAKLLKELNLESNYSVTQEMLYRIIPKYKWREIPIKIHQRENGESFIKLGKYFYKMILIFLNYYIIPKIKSIVSVYK